MDLNVTATPELTLVDDYPAPRAAPAVAAAVAIAAPPIGDATGYVITPSAPDYTWRVVAQCRAEDVPLRLSDDADFYFTTVKPAMDRAAAALLLVLCAPLMVLIALIIRMTDDGPIFFAQRRTGYLGRRFRLIKFRTMVPGAEQIRDQIRHLNIYGDATPDFKCKDDPRITRIGKLLRSTSLDELPNLINVVRGEMSLVGPRPTSFDVSTYSSCHLPRLAVRPGITGLWQVSGRADVDFDRRCELDKDYIRTASFAADTMILVRTVTAVLARDGAH